MTAKREYLDYLQDIFESIGDIEVFVAGMDFERFASDKRTVNAVIRSLEVIGEAAKKIPMDISDAHPGVPWSKMCGMREKLIHEYFGVDRTILWKVATEEIPPLKGRFPEDSGRAPVALSDSVPSVASPIGNPPAAVPTANRTDLRGEGQYLFHENFLLIRSQQESGAQVGKGIP